MLTHQPIPTGSASETPQATLACSLALPVATSASSATPAFVRSIFGVERVSFAAGISWPRTRRLVGVDADGGALPRQGQAIGAAADPRSVPDTCQALAVACPSLPAQQIALSQ